MHTKLLTSLFTLSFTHVDIFIQRHSDDRSSSQKTFHLYLSMQFTVQYMTLTTTTAIKQCHLILWTTGRHFIEMLTHADSWKLKFDVLTLWLWPLTFKMNGDVGVTKWLLPTRFHQNMFSHFVCKVQFRPVARGSEQSDDQMTPGTKRSLFCRLFKRKRLEYRLSMKQN